MRLRRGKAGRGLSMSVLREYLEATAQAGTLTASMAMKEPNMELRRVMIESLGADRFFSQLGGKVVHTDIDGCGNPRELVRLELVDAQAGYVQAVHVICPTTGRQYYLGVPPDVETCQQAVASTFGMTAEQYKPGRET